MKKQFFIKTDYSRYLILLITLILHFISEAQERQYRQNKFRHYSVEDGLSQNTVNCILQDRLGFIWLGTSDGLNRFDGTHFKQYKYYPGDSNCLSAPKVMTLFENDDGKLWIGTDRGGLNIFDPITERFVVYKNIPGDRHSLSSNRVYSICHDTAGFFWIGTLGGGLNRFDTSSKTFQHIRNDSTAFSLIDDNVAKIIKASNGLLYVATRGGLSIIDWENREIKALVHIDGDPLSLKDNRLLNVYEDKKGAIWIGTLNSGLYKYNTNRLTQFGHTDIGAFEIAGNQISDILQISEDDFWIGTFENGISHYNQRENKFNTIHNISGDKYSLNNNHVRCIFEDKQKIIWVGTDGGGVNLYHKSNENFSSFDNLLKENVSPESKNVFCITEDPYNRVWFGTIGAGLFCYDKINDSITVYKHEEGKINSLSSDLVSTLLPLNKDTLVAGTYNGGLNFIDYKTKKIHRRIKGNTSNNAGRNEVILNLYKENDSTIWLGTMKTGLNMLNLNTGISKIFQLNEADKLSLSSNYVSAIYQTRNGQELIGTQRGGLCILNSDRKTFTRLMNNLKDVFSLNSNDVHGIHEDRNGVIWIGTNGGGLNAFDLKTKHFIHYTEKDGLPNNVIYAIFSDKNGDLWLSTNNGICCITPPVKINFNARSQEENKLRRIRNYNSSDGISSNEFNYGAYFQNKEGTIYFGNTNGITCFHPDSITENKYPLPVVFTNFKVFEKYYPLDSAIEYKKQIALQYDQDFFSFEFSGLNYLFPEKNQYAYMMEGFDKTWNFIGNRHYASFTNLDPGSYTFKVKACNNDGVWNENYASIQIVITPPFWKTWWFKMVTALISILSVYVFYRYRIHQIKKEEQKKTAFNKILAEVEMKALRAQMNPHFIFNSLNAINNYIISKDQQAASDYLSRFSRLIRLVLENSMHKEVALDKDIETLELYMQMEQLRFEKGFNYEIKIADSLETESVLIPPLLLQPFVENAIWHGLMSKEGAGKILIQINFTNDTLQCIVEDNGIGREKAGEIKSKRQSGHRSLGMKVTEERIEILKQQKNVDSKVLFTDLKDENGDAVGTRAEIFIPLEYCY